MKRLITIVLTAALGAGALTAEVQTPYTEQFENPSFRPVGWMNVPSSSYATGTYVTAAEGGHSGGYISVKQYSNYLSSYYNNYSYSDVLATPKVSGEVSIWVRKNGTDPTLTFYKMTDQSTLPSSYSAAVLVEGTEVNMVKDKTIDDWTKITVQGVPEGTYIGIRANDLDLDEFSATTADVVPFKLLYCKVDNEGGTTVTASPENKYTLKFKVTMENAGDVDFGGSTPVTVEVYNSPAQTVFGTGQITEALPRGAKVEKHFEITGEHVTVPDVKAYSYSVYLKHPDMSTFNGSLGTLTFIPYEPNPKFMYGEENDKNQSSYNDVDVTEAITVGLDAAPERTLWLWNSGIAEMDVTATTLTGGFTADCTAFTLGAGEKKAVKVTAPAGEGLKEGTITFSEKTLGDRTYSLTALVTAEGKFAEDFEAEAAPAGWVLNNPWKINTVDSRIQGIGGQRGAESSYASTKGMLISPKLKFEAGENLGFTATKKDNTSSLLTVYTSSDRVEWTPALTVNSRQTEGQELFGQDKPTGTGYGTYEFKIFSAPMPEGECYVAFEAGGVVLGDVYGGQAVTVDHDLYVTSMSTPKDGAGSVNARFISSISVRNLLATDETDYRIALFFGDKEIASAAGDEAIPAGEVKSFDIVAVPHDEGIFTATIAFVKGDTRLDLTSFQAVIGPEKAEAVLQVGDEKVTNTDPFNIGYAGVQAQILYPADKLQMDNGSKITGVYFTGVSEHATAKHIKVWAQNTEDTEYPESDIVPAPTSEMTLVYDADYTFPVGGNSSTKEYVPVMELPFTAPFEYTGKSVRLAFELIGGPEGEHGDNVLFMVDNTGYDFWNDVYNHYAIVNKQRYSEDLEDEAYWYCFKVGLPATFFTVAKDVVTVTGAVTDDFGDPVEGASLELSADEFLYRAVSDVRGAYTMNVANIRPVYTLTAKAEGFQEAVKPEIALDAAEPVKTVDMELNWADRTATLSGHVYDSNVNHDQAVGPGVKIALSDGDIDVCADVAQDGSYSLAVPDFSRSYTLSITQDGQQRYSTGFKFASKADNADYYIAYDAIPEIESVAGDNEAEYFNLQGQRVTAPAHGVYIRRTASRAEKVRIR